MGILCDQLVIGQGASALSFLYYAREANNKDLVADSALTYVIGQDDLWAKVSKQTPDHRFGQPTQIVSKPGTVPQTQAKPEFQKASNVTAQLGEMKQDLVKAGIRFRPGTVTKVLRAGGRFQVTTQEGEEYNPRQVIVASGFGPSQRPPKGVLPDDLSTPQYSESIFGGTEYLYESLKVPTHGDFTVAVMGTSATSSWAVARAVALGAKRILWISRGGFDDANPAGRNSEILREANKNKWLVVAGVSKVEASGSRLRLELDKAVSKGAPPEAKLSTLGQHYKNWYDNNKHSAAAVRRAELALEPVVINGKEKFEVDHFVYALGADSALPGGAKHMMSTIVDELVPVFDTDKRFGDVSADTTIAFRTPQGDVWVVGAAVFRMIGLSQLMDDPNAGQKFSNVAKMMSEAGTPPEGIAAIFASMKAVTGYVAKGDKLNIHTADFKEIETWISDLYFNWKGEKKPIPEKTRRVMADQIVAMRKHSVFGLTPEEVARMTDLKNGETVAFWEHMFGPGGDNNNSTRRLIDVLAESA